MWITKKNNKIKRYIELPKYYKHWAGNFDTQSNEIHLEEGFIKVPDVVIDTTTQYLGDIIEISEGVFEWEIINKPTPLLEDLKETHRISLIEVLTEISTIINTVWNTYDPTYSSKNSLPVGFEDLIVQVPTIRTTVYEEIDALATVEEAQVYVVRTADINTLVEDLKAYL